jgi:hypothetical protein
VSQTIPSGHRAASRRMHAFHPHGVLLVTVYNSEVTVGLIWAARNLQEKMAEAMNRSPVLQALQLTGLFVGGTIWQQKQPHISFVSVWL